MNLDHSYAVSVEWTGNRGTGTSAYRAYGRDLLVSAEGKPPIEGSSDHAFFGDADRWNPEELLVAALSQCHMLSYLHAAAEAGVVVESLHGRGDRHHASGRQRRSVHRGDPPPARHHLRRVARARASTCTRRRSATASSPRA